MRVRRRLAVVAGSIGVLVLIALYPRTNAPLRTELLSHGYSYGTGYAANCPTALSLGVSTHKVVAGAQAKFLGSLTTESGFSPAFQPIKFFQALFGQGSFSQISGATTNVSGAYTKTTFPSKNATFKTQWGPLTGAPLACPAVMSGRATILVYVRVPWLLGERPVRNNPVLLYGSVRPPHAGQLVRFRYQRIGDATFRYANATLDGLSNFFINFSFDRSGPWRMRASFFDLDPNHEGNFLEKIINVG